MFLSWQLTFCTTLQQLKLLLLVRNLCMFFWNMIPQKIYNYYSLVWLQINFLTAKYPRLNIPLHKLRRNSTVISKISNKRIWLSVWIKELAWVFNIMTSSGATNESVVSATNKTSDFKKSFTLFVPILLCVCVWIYQVHICFVVCQQIPRKKLNKFRFNV